MPLFGHPKPEDLARQARDKQSREQLERGGLSLDAEERLNALKSKSALFTSNLSINEFVLTSSQGIRPLGQVMGSTIYHVGWQMQPMYSSAELRTLSHAQHQARYLALGRLQQEAKLLGAHGVVGVRLERKSYEWGASLIEWTARGTAVALASGKPADLPFVCALSGQEYWTLQQAGYHPVGFAFGTCVFYHVASYNTQWVNQGGFFGGYAGNVELTDYTQAVYETRRIAMHRLTDDAARVQADGVVGVTVEPDIRTVEVETTNDQTRRDLIVSFTVLGTAVSSSPHPLPAVDYLMTLSD